MTNSNADDQPEPTIDLRVATVLQDWMDRREQGSAESAEELIAQYPELNPELRECMESIELLDSTALVTARPKPQNLYPKIPDFQILHELGRGGMGIVYEAKQKSLARNVALKVLPLATVDPLAAQRFQREAETAAALHHTNIVPIYAVGHAEGIHWYAMQRIEGRPLSWLLKEHPRGVDSDEVARIGFEAADALAYAHRNGVIHRDIKPGNLLIEQNGRVWLADFGLARRDVDASATITGAMLGTPRYMSPEQVFCSPQHLPDHRSDIYSLGATLYEIATGTALFDAATPLDVLQQIRMADPPRPRTIRPGMPRDLEVVLQKCLSKDPAERYQTAEGLASDLRAIREGRPIAARGLPIWTVLRRRLARHRQPIQFASTMIAATAAIIICGFGLWRHYQGSRQGSMRTSAAGGPYVATIFPVDENGSSAIQPVATLTVPMQAPLSLDAGEYKMRLAGPDKFSEMVRFGILPGTARELRYVDRRLESDPIDIEDKLVSTVSASDGRTYLAALDDSTLSIFGHGGKLVLEVRTDAIAGDGEPADFSYHIDQKWAGNRNAMRPYGAKPQRLASSAIDLNGDQADDFVISARDAPVIAAIDTQGNPLWSRRFDLPENGDFPVMPPTDRYNTPWDLPFVLEILPIEDLDSDGTPDLVVSLVRIDPNFGCEPFLITVSGKSGDPISIATLPPTLRIKSKATGQTSGNLAPSTATPKLMTSWPMEGMLRYRSQKLDEREAQTLFQIEQGRQRRNDYIFERKILFSTTSIAGTLPVTVPLHLAEFNGKQVAVTVSNDSISTWDLSTGAQVGESISTPFQLAARPIAVNLGKDAGPAFFAWSSGTDDAGNSVPHRCGLFVLGEPKPRWVKPYHLPWELLANAQEKSDLPLAVDLDGDAVDELLVPSRDVSFSIRNGRLDCLDAATGNSKWANPHDVNGIELLPERAVAVRDCNGDGVRDVAVASLVGRESGDQNWTANRQGRSFSFFLDLIDGSDGTLLRWHRVPIPVGNQILQILHIDSICYHETAHNSEVTASIVYGDTPDETLESMTIRVHLIAGQEPEIASGISLLGSPKPSESEGFFRRRTGRDGIHGDAAIWLPESADNKNRIGETNLLASWTDPEGSQHLLLAEPSGRQMSAVNSQSGQLTWAYPHHQAEPHVAVVNTNDGTVTDLVVQTATGTDSAPQLLDAKTGRVRCRVPINLGRIIRAFDCEDTAGNTIWILANASVGNNADRGLKLVKANRITGAVIWQRHFFDNLTHSQLRPPKVAMLRVDCDNDGVLDAVVPTEGKDTAVAIAVISGVDGRIRWTHDIQARNDRWSNEVPWPPMAHTGPAEERRIVLLDPEGPTSFALRMFSAARGVEVDKRLFDSNLTYGNTGGFHVSGFGRIELVKLQNDEPWATFTVAYPVREKGKKDAKAWLQVASSEAGFSEPSAADYQTDRKSKWFTLDVDGDGQRERVELSNNHLRCVRGDTILFVRQFDDVVTFDRIHSLRSGNPVIGLWLATEKFYCLVNLADGDLLYQSETPGIDFAVNKFVIGPTPRLQSTDRGLQLVRASSEGIQSIEILNTDSIAPDFVLAGNTRHDPDPRLMTRLPNSVLWGGQTLGGIVLSFTQSTFLTLLALILPVAFVGRLILRRQWTLGYLMMSPIVAVLAMLAWQYLLDPLRMISIDPNASEPWPVVLFGGCVACAAIAFLIRSIRNKEYWILAIPLGLAVMLTMISIGLPLLVQRLASNGSQYSWGADDVLATLILISMNMMMFAYLIRVGVSVMVRFIKLAGTQSSAS